MKKKSKKQYYRLITLKVGFWEDKQNWDRIKHLLWPHYETRYQLQEKKTVRNTNIQRLSNMFLNNQQVTEEIQREIKKFLETNDNENMTTQNLWDAAKAVLRGKQYNPTSRNKKNIEQTT